MAGKRRIAVVMELNWPYKRHYGIFAGIQEYAGKHADWSFDVGNYPEFELARGSASTASSGGFRRTALRRRGRPEFRWST